MKILHSFHELELLSLVRRAGKPFLLYSGTLRKCLLQGDSYLLYSRASIPGHRKEQTDGNRGFQHMEY